MTYRPIKIAPDGVRIYSDGRRYTPVAVEDRTYAVLKPSHPGAYRWNNRWSILTDMLDGDSREMPTTWPYKDARASLRQ